MKKILVAVSIIILLLCFNKTKEITIPSESIRFRIIANSNSIKDQKLKKEIVNKISRELEDTITEEDTVFTAREKIEKYIPNIENKINKTLSDNDSNTNISIEYGYNYFPEKKYKGIKYEAGNYESLIIKIGESKGKNFWCVLFPPLCNIDDPEEEYEYTSLVREIVKKYNNKHKIK